jgi:hypothetical protein
MITQYKESVFPLTWTVLSQLLSNVQYHVVHLLELGVDFRMIPAERMS